MGICDCVYAFVLTHVYLCELHLYIYAYDVSIAVLGTRDRAINKRDTVSTHIEYGPYTL